MATSEFGDGKVNIKELIQKLVSKWYIFLIAQLVLVPVAFAYIYFADNVFLIRASILLNGEVKNGLSSEKFLKGMELMSSHTELEDEIGILKSFNLSESTIGKLDFGILYFSKSNFRSFERYGKNFPFKIELDSTVNQMIDVPIFVERTSDSTYKIHASANEANSYNFYTKKIVEHLSNIEINSSGVNKKLLTDKNLR